MAEIIGKSEQDFKELKELLEECTKGFVDCMKFYKFTPKKGKVEDAKPEEFFSIWHPFCEDYKNIWKKEQVIVRLLSDKRIGMMTS
jgi:formin 2